MSSSDPSPALATPSPGRKATPSSGSEPKLATERVVALGAALVLFGMFGFYFIPGMILEEAGGHRLVNAFYCAVITLTTVGFGDICPADPDVVGRVFILMLCFGGLGFFCGPMMTLTSSWQDSVPGGITTISSLTLALGVGLFSTVEEMSYTEAMHLSIVTGTTIGYGNLTPTTNMGRFGVAVYALLVINVMSGLLQPARKYLESFCMEKTRKRQ